MIRPLIIMLELLLPLVFENCTFHSNAAYQEGASMYAIAYKDLFYITTRQLIQLLLLKIHISYIMLTLVPLNRIVEAQRWFSYGLGSQCCLI